MAGTRVWEGSPTACDQLPRAELTGPRAVSLTSRSPQLGPNIRTSQAQKGNEFTRSPRRPRGELRRPRFPSQGESTHTLSQS